MEGKMFFVVMILLAQSNRSEGQLTELFRNGYSVLEFSYL
jgi:hypothetical protein